MADGQQISSLYARIGAEISDFQKGMATVKGDLETVKGSFGKVGQVIGGAFSVVAIAAATAKVAEFAKGCAMAASAIAPVQASFERLTASAGQSSDALLSAMTQASQGTMSQAAMMKEANYAMMTIGEEAASQLPKMMEIAVAAARSTGNTVDYMFKSITMGTARQSKLILDNLGIIVDSGKAYEDYAKSIGVSSDALTDQQQKIAYLNAVMKAGDALIAKVGQSHASAATNIAQAGAAAQDAKVAIGEGLLPAYTALSGVFSDAIVRIRDMVSEGGSLYDNIQRIGEAVEGAIPFLTSLAETITGTVIPAFVTLIEKVVGFGSAVAEHFQGIKEAVDAGKESLVEQFGTWDNYAAAMKRAGESVMIGREEFNKLWNEVNNVQAPLNMAADAADNMSVRARMAFEKTAAAAQDAGAATVDAADKWDDWAKKVSSAVDSGMSSIRQTMDNHYQQMADMASNAQLENIKAEAEYNAERARLVASGNNEAVAKLDAAFKKEKILRDLNNRIAQVQTNAKYQMELTAQKQALASKIAMMIAESGADANTKAAMLSVLRNTMGATVTADAEFTVKTLALLESRKVGSRLAAESIISDYQAIVNAMQATWTAQEQAAAGGAGSVNWAQYQQQIQEAYNQAAQFTGVGGGSSGGGGGGGGNDPAADLAAMVDGMLENIASIRERLAEEMPDIVTPIQEWFDALIEVGEQVKAWKEQPGVKSFIKEFKDHVYPTLQKFAEALEPVGALLDTIVQIANVQAQEIGAVKTSMATYLTLLKSVTETIQAWVTDNNIAALAESFNENVRPALEKWVRSVQPISELLSTAVAIMDSLATETQPVRTSVTTFLTYLKGAMMSVAEWFGRDQGWAGFVDYYDKDLRQLIEKWVEVTKPIADLLGTAKNIMDDLAAKTEPVRTSVTTFLKYLKGAMLGVAEWFGKDPGWAGFLDYFERDYKPHIEKWIEVTKPIAELFSIAKTIMDQLGEKAKPLQTTVAEVLQRIVDVMRAFKTWSDADLTLPSLVDEWGKKIQPLVEKLLASIKPIGDLFSVAKSVFDALAMKVPSDEDIFAGIVTVFRGLKRVVKTINDYYDWMSLMDPFPDMAQAVKDWLDKVRDTIAPISNALSQAKSIFDALGQDVPTDEELFVGVVVVFRGLRRVVKTVEDYYNWMIRMEPWPKMDDATQKWLDKTKEAIAPLSTLFSSVNAIFKALGEKLPEAKTTVSAMLDAAKQVISDVVDAFKNADWSELFTALTEDVQAQMSTVAKAVGDINSIIGGAVSALKSLGEKTPAFRNDKLLDLMGNMRTAIDTVLSVFKDKELDTERLDAIRQSAEAVRGTVNAMDGMAKAIKDINIPNAAKLQQLMTALAGGTFNGQHYEGIIPTLNGLPLISSSVSDSFANLASAISALKLAVRDINDLRGVNIEGKGGLNEGLAAVQRIIDTLNAKAITFGDGMRTALSYIVNMGQDEGQQTVHGLITEFVEKVKTMASTLSAELDAVLKVLGPDGAFLTTIKGYDWSTPGSDLADPFKTGLVDKVNEAMSAVDSLLNPNTSPWAATWRGYDWNAVGQSIGQSLLSGIKAGAASGTVTVQVNLQVSNPGGSF